MISLSTFKKIFKYILGLIGLICLAAALKYPDLQPLLLVFSAWFFYVGIVC